MQTHGLNNIVDEVPIDLSTSDFVDENGFFLRSGTDAIVRYCPMNRPLDSQAITKPITANPYFVDPVLMRKVFRLVTSPDADFYAGYGV